MAATKRYVVGKSSDYPAKPDEVDQETLQHYLEIISELQTLESKNPSIRAYIPSVSGPATLEINFEQFESRHPLKNLSRLRRGPRWVLPAAITTPRVAAVLSPRIAAVRNVTEALSQEMIRLGVDLSGVDTPRLVRSLLHAVPRTDSNELADRTGPFYDTAGMVSWLGITRQALDKKVRSGKLLACMTSDRVRLYPVWQFTDSGDTIPGFTDVLAVLSQGTKDSWTIALWMVTKVEQLEGKSAVEWLSSGADSEPVLASARNDAAAWAA